MKKFILTMEDELHKKAKVDAAQKGITLNELITKAIEKWLDGK